MPRPWPFWLLLACAAIACWVVAARGEPCWTVDVVEVLHVVDGDTVDVRVATWLSGLPGRSGPPETKVERIRLLAVDTPELKGETLAAGREAAAFTAAWLRERDVTITACRRDSMGRVLAHIEGRRRLKDDTRVTVTVESLARALLEAGHAVPFR